MDTASKELAVIDSSYVLSYLLPDETNRQVDAFFKGISSKSLYSPSLLEYEVANALVTAHNRSRITRNEMTEVWQLFKELPIIYMEVSLEKALDMSIKKSLSVYDASYIVLSKELGCELHTLDKKLIPGLR